MSVSIFAHRMATFRASLPWSHDDLLAEMQTTLAALADIECRYEADREADRQEAGSDADWRHLSAARESRYRQEREPYLRNLHELQRRMRTRLRYGL